MESKTSWLPFVTSKGGTTRAGQRPTSQENARPDDTIPKGRGRDARKTACRGQGESVKRRSSGGFMGGYFRVPGHSRSPIPPDHDVLERAGFCGHHGGSPRARRKRRGERKLTSSRDGTRAMTRQPEQSRKSVGFRSANACLAGVNRLAPHDVVGVMSDWPKVNRHRCLGRTKTD